MSFRQETRDRFDTVWNVINGLSCIIAKSKEEIEAHILPLETKICNLEKAQCETVIKTSGLKNQIADFKQELCDLRIGHQYKYREDFGPKHFIFVCELCGNVLLVSENELTPAQRKALQILGVLENESAKKCSD